MAAADLDGDGKLDLVLLSHPSQVIVLRGLGDGSFAAPVAYDGGTSPYAIAAANVDGDWSREGQFS